jgi:hypothetical protein
MTDDKYEPKRVLGFPVTRDPNARHDTEPQRVMGFSSDQFDGIDMDWIRSLAHPIRGYRRWLRRRRFGPYAIDEGERGPRR